MTVPASVITGAGLRRVYIYELDSAGIPKHASTTWYAGVDVQGARLLTVNVPQARRIPHIGNDRFQGYTVLPPTDGISAELRSGKKDISLEALLKGQNVVTVGETKWHGVNTDKDGDEIQVALLEYGAAEDRDDASAAKGALRWTSLLLPRATLYSRRGNADENAYEHIFDVTPYAVNQYPWGKAFAVGTEAYTEANALEGIHEGKPRLLSATGDGATAAFPFPAGIVATSVDKVKVFENGIDITSTLTVTINGITYSGGSEPANTDKIVCLLEHV